MPVLGRAHLHTYRHTLKAHPYDEVGGPVGQSRNGDGSRTWALAEQLSHNKPRNGSRADFEKCHEAQDGDDAKIGHPRHLNLAEEEGEKIESGNELLIVFPITFGGILEFYFLFCFLSS